MSGINRRHFVGSPLLLAAGSGRAAPSRITSLGVYSLIGDEIDVTVADAPANSRLDGASRHTLEVRQIGFDNIVLRTVRDAVLRSQPDARVLLFRAPNPLPSAEQRAIVAGARKAELPAWIMQTAERDKLAQLLVIGRHRADAAFPVVEGHTLGRAKLDGVGYHMDPIVLIRNADNGAVAEGLLGAFALFAMVMLDAMTGDVLADVTVHEQRGIAPREHAATNDPWNRLSPTERAETLRDMVELAARRGIAKVLTAH